MVIVSHNLENHFPPVPSVKRVNGAPTGGGRGVVKGGKGHPLPIFDTTKRCVFETNVQASVTIEKPFKGPRQGVVGRKKTTKVSPITNR